LDPRGKLLALSWVAFVLAMNWPVLAWVQGVATSTPRLVWVGPLPFHYFWVIAWSLAAFTVLVTMGCTVARELARRAEALEGRPEREG
jgi:hypothetical protein